MHLDPAAQAMSRGLLGWWLRHVVHRLPATEEAAADYVPATTEVGLIGQFSTGDCPREANGCSTSVWSSIRRSISATAAWAGLGAQQSVAIFALLSLLGALLAHFVGNSVDYR